MIRFPGILDFKMETAGGFVSATGGTVSYIGDYKIHTFTSSGDFQVLNSLTDVSIFIVSAGGSGGNTYSYAQAGGGGGAGGVSLFKINLNVGTYPVVVGSATSGTGKSSFNTTYYANKGGSGGGGNGTNGYTGGSGGGGGQGTLMGATSGGDASAGSSTAYGNAGGSGNATSASPYTNGSGGGGGAGGAGASATSHSAGGTGIVFMGTTYAEGGHGCYFDSYGAHPASPTQKTTKGSGGYGGIWYENPPSKYWAPSYGNDGIVIIVYKYK